MQSIQDVVIDTFPTTPEEFNSLRDRIATTPAGGAAMLVLAMNIYMWNEELGLNCLTLISDMKHVSPNSSGYRAILALAIDWKMRVRDHPHIAPSYIVGTHTANGYVLPPAPWVVRVDLQLNNPHSVKQDNRYKLFIACSGASSPRPITLARNDVGIWKVDEWSSVQVGVAKPGPGHDPL